LQPAQAPLMGEQQKRAAGKHQSQREPGQRVLQVIVRERDDRHACDRSSGDRVLDGFGINEVVMRHR
jgi:hypothetical protein